MKIRVRSSLIVLHRAFKWRLSVQVNGRCASTAKEESRMFLLFPRLLFNDFFIESWSLDYPKIQLKGNILIYAILSKKKKKKHPSIQLP